MCFPSRSTHIAPGPPSTEASLFKVSFCWLSSQAKQAIFWSLATETKTKDDTSSALLAFDWLKQTTSNSKQAKTSRFINSTFLPLTQIFNVQLEPETRTMIGHSIHIPTRTHPIH
jgi:hypothetical protein